MREIRSSGSVEGVMSNRDPYSDFLLVSFDHGIKTILPYEPDFITAS